MKEQHTKYYANRSDSKTKQKAKQNKTCHSGDTTYIPELTKKEI